jgi:hypothetical protein
MRFLALGLGCLCCGFFMLGLGSSLLFFGGDTWPAFVPLGGACLSAVGYWLCRPALLQAKRVVAA